MEPHLDIVKQILGFVAPVLAIIRFWGINSSKDIILKIKRTTRKRKG